MFLTINVKNVQKTVINVIRNDVKFVRTVSSLMIRTKNALSVILKTVLSAKTIKFACYAKEGCFGMRRRKNALLAITGVSNVLKREIIAWLVH